MASMSMEMEQVLKLWKNEESDSEFSLYDFDQIADATRNFSNDYKLGQGGFGPVYKVTKIFTLKRKGKPPDTELVFFFLFGKGY